MSERPKMRALLRADYDHLLRLSLRTEGRSLWRAIFSPRALPVVLIRLAEALYAYKLGLLGEVVRMALLFGFRVEVPRGASIGPGFVLPHPTGIVLGHAKIGRNVVVFQNVTLGARHFDGAYDLGTRPTLEDGVTVGAGAAVLGPVNVGRNAIVAANSLVLDDVPSGNTAIGVPARMSAKST